MFFAREVNFGAKLSRKTHRRGLQTSDLSRIRRRREREKEREKEREGRIKR